MRIERNKMTSVPDPLQIQSLAETPDVRAEKVARGKALIADPNYPPKEQMKAIAGVLADNIVRRKTASRPASVSRLRDIKTAETANH
jgi:hypothetical protein